MSTDGKHKNAENRTIKSQENSRGTWNLFTCPSKSHVIIFYCLETYSLRSCQGTAAIKIKCKNNKTINYFEYNVDMCKSGFKLDDFKSYVLMHL